MFQPVQILPMNSTVLDVLNFAALAVHDGIEDERNRMVQTAD